MKQIPLPVVVGPTAAGKTALSIALAKALNGEIVSADSMQIYGGMPIATAAPTAAQKAEVPHHLVEFLPPDAVFSVADYRREADRVIGEILARGKQPVVVGGTGFYISALVDHLDFTAPPSNGESRRQWEEAYDTLGGEVLLEQLRQQDAATAARLHANDRKRLVRALELLDCGTSISAQNELSRREASPYEPIMVGVTYRDRKQLYARIDDRVDEMVAQGLLEEARHFSGGVTARAAIGHKELAAYFRNEISLEEALEHLKRQTRRYAKRQLTWFRRDERVHWFYADEEDVVPAAIEYVKGRLTL